MVGTLFIYRSYGLGYIMLKMISVYVNIVARFGKNLWKGYGMKNKLIKCFIQVTKPVEYDFCLSEKIRLEELGHECIIHKVKKRPGIYTLWRKITDRDLQDEDFEKYVRASFKCRGELI